MSTQAEQAGVQSSGLIPFEVRWASSPLGTASGFRLLTYQLVDTPRWDDRTRTCMQSLLFAPKASATIHVA